MKIVADFEELFARRATENVKEDAFQSSDKKQ